MIEEESSRLETRRTSDQTLQIPSFLFLFFSRSFSLLFLSFLLFFPPSFPYDCTVEGLCSRGAERFACSRVVEELVRKKRGSIVKHDIRLGRRRRLTWPRCEPLTSMVLPLSVFERPLNARPFVRSPAVLPAHHLYVDKNDCIGKLSDRLNTGHRNWLGQMTPTIDTGLGKCTVFLQVFHRKSR